MVGNGRQKKKKKRVSIIHLMVIGHGYMPMAMDGSDEELASRNSDGENSTTQAATRLFSFWPLAGGL